MWPVAVFYDNCIAGMVHNPISTGLQRVRHPTPLVSLFDSMGKSCEMVVVYDIIQRGSDLEMRYFGGILTINNTLITELTVTDATDVMILTPLCNSKLRLPILQ